jgi:ATP-binding cassette subfamily F protein 3
MGYRAYEAKLAEERARQAQQVAQAIRQATPVATAGSVPTTPGDKAARIAAHERRKEGERKRRRRERRFTEIEDRIMSVENRLLEIDEELASPDNAADWEKLRDLTVERTATKEKLDALYEQWATMERSSSAGM